MLVSSFGALDEFDTIDQQTGRSFHLASAVLASALAQHSSNTSASNNNNTDVLMLVQENVSSDLLAQRNKIERECDTNHFNVEMTSFESMLNTCLTGRSTSSASNDSLYTTTASSTSLYLPFATDTLLPFDLDSLFAPPPPPPSPPPTASASQPSMLFNFTRTSSDETQAYVVDPQEYEEEEDEEDEEEEEEVVKAKKKKTTAKKASKAIRDISIQEISIAIQNTTMAVPNRPLAPKKLSSKWSAGTGKTSTGIGAKLARQSVKRLGSALRVRRDNSANGAFRLSQEQRERDAIVRKEQECKRKVEKCHEEAKKRQEVLQRGKELQKAKDLKNQLRISDQQAAPTKPAGKKGPTPGMNTSSNTSLNDLISAIGTTYNKTPGQVSKFKAPIILDPTSKNLLGPKKAFAPSATNATNEQTFVVDRTQTLCKATYPLSLPSSSLVQPSDAHLADWTILASPMRSKENEDPLDVTVTSEASDGKKRPFDPLAGDYGLQDAHSDEDEDDDGKTDERRVPGWAKEENLYQTFWKGQGHWYTSKRSYKWARRHFGHNATITKLIHDWLKELKSSKPLSETFDDASYLFETTQMM